MNKDKATDKSEYQKKWRLDHPNYNKEWREKHPHYNEVQKLMRKLNKNKTKET